MTHGFQDPSIIDQPIGKTPEPFRIHSPRPSLWDHPPLWLIALSCAVTAGIVFATWSGAIF